MKKLLKWALVAFLVFFVVKNPTGAAAYVAGGQVEHAASVAHAALPVARGAGSSRIVGEIKRVGAELVPHRPLSAVAALLDDLDAGDR
jgi:hypothetical protein